MIHPFYEHRIVVRPGDIDENLHANNVCYVRWMQDAATAHSKANGWTSERYIKLGSIWVARRHTIDYLAPAIEGDQITVKTWIASWKRASSVRRYHFIRESDSLVLAKAETNWAFINIASGRPTKIAEDVANSFIVYNE